VIFGEFPLAECEGLLLAHSLRLADGIFKKGRRLASADFPALDAAGITRVYGARLEPGDLDENAAAAAVAATLTGSDIAARAPHAGRCNLYATQRGLVGVDAAIIDRINAIDESVTVATLPPLTAVRAGAVVATVKVIPLAVGRGVIDACSAAAGQGTAMSLLPFQARRAALIVTGLPGEPARNYAAAVTSSRRRLDELGSHLGLVQRCAHRSAAVTAALLEARAAGCDLLLIAGSTVPKDRADTVPAAIVAAGGEIDHFGMPVEPGNMLLLARLGEVPVIILPGCARSRRTNGLDWVLQRMLAGLPMGRAEIMAMGVGGLIRSPLEARGRSGDPAGTAARARRTQGGGAGAGGRQQPAHGWRQQVVAAGGRHRHAAPRGECGAGLARARRRPASPGWRCSSCTTPITPAAWPPRCVAGWPRCRPMPTRRWCCWPTCPASTAGTSIACSPPSIRGNRKSSLR
jgi:molybdenum cofactor cytidylyltransferase